MDWHLLGETVVAAAVAATVSAAMTWAIVFVNELRQRVRKGGR